MNNGYLLLSKWKWQGVDLEYIILHNVTVKEMLLYNPLYHLHKHT